MTITMILMGTLLVAVGAVGYRRLDELIPALPSYEDREQRRRVLRRGTVAFQVFGILLLVVAILRLVN